MNKIVLITLLMIVIAFPVAAAPPDSYFEITSGPGIDICTSQVFFVNINLVLPEGTFAYSSEAIVPGFGSLGYYADTISGPLSTTMNYGFEPSAYTVPPGTVITVSITNYDGPTTSDPVSNVATAYINCTTGTLTSAPLIIETAPLFDQINMWADSLDDVIFMAFAIGIALLLLLFIGSRILAVFRGAG